MRIPVIPLLVPVMGLWSCTAQRPVAEDAEAAAARELVAQNVNAALYQNASAEVAWLYEQGYAYARLKLDANLAMPDSLPPAVIVDVDETVLDNSPYQASGIRDGRTFDQDSWRTWTDLASAKACPGALDFLRFARSAGCEVFYITNRDIREKASTLKNLNDLGFPDADEAHLLLMDGTSDKTERRARVRATHNVVLLAGDQLRDFDERFKDRSANYGRDAVDALSDSLSQHFILLPNPMYGTWRDAVQGKGTDAEKLARMKAWFQINGY